MRKVLFIAGLLFLTAGFASAACSKFDVGGGYRYVRVSSGLANELFTGGAFNMNGWDAEAAYNPTCWLGVVGDFGGVYGSVFGVGVHFYEETFGPRVYLPKLGPVKPFAEGLFGDIQGAVPEFDESQSAFGAQFGGGVDISLGGPFVVRTRLDDIYTHFFSMGHNSLGVTAEVVFKFGGH
jgi:hypothetical protein